MEESCDSALMEWSSQPSVKNVMFQNVQAEWGDVSKCTGRVGGKCFSYMTIKHGDK